MGTVREGQIKRHFGTLADQNQFLFLLITVFTNKVFLFHCFFPTKMKTVFIVVLLLHGLIHFLGFLKGFGLAEIKQLEISISRGMAVLWLLAGLCIALFGILSLQTSDYAWILGLVAIALSQLVIISAWSEARFGTIPNLMMLVAIIIGFGQWSFKKQISRETTEIIDSVTGLERSIVDDAQLAVLPKAVQAWYEASGAANKPKVTYAKVKQQALMKMKPDQEKWMEALAVQYTSVEPPAFIWTVEADMNPLLYFRGRDRFLDGRGQMLIKLNDVVRIVDESGEKLDEGTIQRYLGELVWFPSLAFSPYITWKPVNDTTAIAELNYKGTTGSGTFYFSENGDFKRFSTWRYQGNEEERKEWILDVLEYDTFEGIRVPSLMTATWRLDEGDWTWLKLEIEDIEYHFEGS